jgi:hypothetical protein
VTTEGSSVISFFCIRCGTALEIDDDHPAGHAVRCATCRSVVRTPEIAAEIPDARLAPPRLEGFAVEAPAEGEPPLATPFEAASLDYGIASYPPSQFRDEDALNELAERLKRVEHNPAPDAEDTMTECRICGSTIAGFIRHCPFCRNSLVGRA